MKNGNNSVKNGLNENFQLKCNTNNKIKKHLHKYK